MGAMSTAGDPSSNPGPQDDSLTASPDGPESPLCILLFYVDEADRALGVRHSIEAWSLVW